MIYFCQFKTALKCHFAKLYFLVTCTRFCRRRLGLSAVNMRRSKISLKKYFYLTLVCALVLIFVLNLREREVWKSKGATLQSPLQQQQQQAAAQVHANAGQQQLDEDSGDADDDDGEDEEDARNAAAVLHVAVPRNEPLTNLVSITSMEPQHVEHDAAAAVVASTAGVQLELHAPDEPARKAWFFRNGDYFPTAAPLPTPRKGKRKGKKHLHTQGSKMFPYQDPHTDRIVNQLMYVPPNYEQVRASGKLKSILLYNGLGPWNIKQGRDVFLRAKCPVDTCELIANRDRANTADMVLYKDHYIPTGIRRSANSRQVTMLYYLECPYHTQNVKVPDAINWTSTYRRDSDIVAPYEKWMYYENNVRQQEQDRNYALNKTKKVAWFVSNCGARNGRLQYAHELMKYIDVDIYGACGEFKCSRSTADKCFEVLDRDYKFYLAFENSNCRDYITEKFYVNALNRNVLPIVMGARPEDYELGAPHRSYIHVDEFSSPKELAEYLHILDKDDELYNSYFKWKGTGELINTFFWCRVCAALHDEESLRKPRWYPDVNDWWRGPGVCTTSSWRNFKARKDVMSDD